MTAIAPWDPARADWIDQRTGKLSREAQIWLRDLWTRAGGATGDSSAELRAMVDSLTVRLQSFHVPDVQVRGGDGVTVARTVDGWQVGMDLLAILPFLPREKPQRDVADSQAVLAQQVYGY